MNKLNYVFIIHIETQILNYLINLNRCNGIPRQEKLSRIQDNIDRSF